MSRETNNKTKGSGAGRAPLSKDRVLTAALHLADRSGIHSLSMRKIAAELDVQAMSLYNHVANKEEILDGLVEMVVAEIEIPRLDDDWKVAMRRRGRSAHDVLFRHPWAISILITRTSAGPKILRYIDATIGCLRKAGFSYEIADHAWNAMDNHIYGFTLQEVNFPFEEAEYPDTAREFLPRINSEDYPYFTELATLVMERRYSGVHDFEFGLKLILDGLEAYRDRN
jgi:AcrR family transcriptional regulator